MKHKKFNSHGDFMDEYDAQKYVFWASKSGHIAVNDMDRTHLQNTLNLLFKKIGGLKDIFKSIGLPLPNGDRNNRYLRSCLKWYIINYGDNDFKDAPKEEVKKVPKEITIITQRQYAVMMKKKFPDLFCPVVMSKEQLKILRSF